MVRLRVEGGRASSAVEIRQTLEEAMTGKAPDAAAVEIEGLPGIPIDEDGHARVALPLV